MGQYKAVAILVVDVPNLYFQTLDALKPEDGERGYWIPPLMRPDYLALKEWWQARHPDIQADLIVFTNLNRDDRAKLNWVKHLRSKGIHVEYRERRTRIATATGAEVTTDIDGWMRKAIRRRTQRPFKLYEAIALSHDVRCFGGNVIRPEASDNPYEPGLFDHLMKSGVRVGYMGFEGLDNSPSSLQEGVQYIDVGEVPGFLSPFFPRHDLGPQKFSFPPVPVHLQPGPKPSPQLVTKVRPWWRRFRWPEWLSLRSNTSNST